MMRGPGYARMLKNLGKDGFEKIRLDTVRRQNEMREKVSGEKVEEPRDRRSYREYPEPE